MLRKLGFIAIVFSILYPALTRQTFVASLILFPVAVLAIYVPDVSRWLKYVMALAMTILSLASALFAIPPALFGGVLTFLALRSANQHVQPIIRQEAYTPINDVAVGDDTQPMRPVVVAHIAPPPPPPMINAVRVGQNYGNQRQLKPPKKKQSLISQLAILVLIFACFISAQAGIQFFSQSVEDARIAAENKSSSDAAADIARVARVARGWRVSAYVTEDKSAAVLSMEITDKSANMREIAGVMTGYAKANVRGVQDVTVLLQQGAETIAFYWSAETDEITQQDMSNIVAPATP